MSLKLPVLATNVGGNPELIKDKHNGFLVEKGNYIDFAKNLEKLILNSELRNKFGVNSYQMIKKKFSFKKTLKQYKNLYKNT